MGWSPDQDRVNVPFMSISSLLGFASCHTPFSVQIEAVDQVTLHSRCTVGGIHGMQNYICDKYVCQWLLNPCEVLWGFSLSLPYSQLSPKVRHMG